MIGCWYVEMCGQEESGREIGRPYGQNLIVMNSLLTGMKPPIDRNKNVINPFATGVAYMRQLFHCLQ